MSDSASASFRFSLLVVTAILLFPAVDGRGVVADPPSHVEGQVLVRFHDDATPGERLQLIREYGGCLRDYARHQRNHHDFFSNLVLLKLPDGDGCRCQEAVDALNQEPAVVFAELDLVQEPVQAAPLPDDPEFWRQDSAHNTGANGGTPDADMDLPEAWTITTGNSSVIVGIIDTGVDYTHPDLAASMWVNPDEIPGNGIDDDLNGFVDDVHGADFSNWDGDPYDDASYVAGHGTVIAGVIAARGNNQAGIAGVAWGSRIMALKISRTDGAPIGISNGISAVQYGLQEGARIFNYSWSSSFSDINAVNATVAAVNAAGGFYVHAAGNDNLDLQPGRVNRSGKVIVGGSDKFDRKASYSNYGTWLDVCAPSNVYSTDVGGGYSEHGGTSFAAPQVCGVLALLLGQGQPRETALGLLINGCDDIDALNPAYAGKLGCGRVNAHTSLSHISDTAPPTAPTLTSSSVSWTQVTLAGAPSVDDRKVAGYQVEKSSDGVTFTVVDGRFKTLPVTIGGLPLYQNQWFRLRAYDVKGNLSAPSNVLSLYVPGPPSAPSLTGPLNGLVYYEYSYTAAVAAPAGGQSKIRFQWSDGPTWESAMVPNGTPVSMVRTWYVPGPCELQLRATDPAGTTSVTTRVINIQPDLPPSAPTGLAATVVSAGSSYQVNLQWTAPPDPDVVSYYVFRSTKSGSGYVWLQSGFVFSGPTAGTDQTTLEKGKTYYYVVKAIDRMNEGPISNQAKAVIPRR